MVLSLSTGDLLYAYIVSLNKNPLRTKAYTSATLSALSELIASAVTGDKDPKTGSVLSTRIPKMFAYGLFVSGPLSHYLVNKLQKAFQGRTGFKANLLQILAFNAVVTPIQSLVFLVFMAIFAGADKPQQILASIRRMYLTLLRNSWVTSPFLLAIAQKYLPKPTWTPFFSLCAFVLSTYNNIKVKRRAQSQQERRKEE